jgi:hypothetical protein
VTPFLFIYHSPLLVPAPTIGIKKPDYRFYAKPRQSGSFTQPWQPGYPDPGIRGFPSHDYSWFGFFELLCLLTIYLANAVPSNDYFITS